VSALAERPPDQRESPTTHADVEDGVIKEARRRQRRRRATVAFVIVLAALGVVVAFGRSGRPLRASGPGTGRPGPVLALDNDALFSQPPYMGVSCGVPNSIACDRIGLTVWLRSPARAVAATIAGRTFRLDNPTWSGALHHGLRTAFAGFVQPAGITTRLGVTTEQGTHWDGSDGPDPLVVLTIARPGQPATQAWVAVHLTAGWG
jgi:hypothetical protein